MDKMNIKNPHDPKNYMGIWTAIHNVAKAGTEGNRRQFSYNAIVLIASTLGCKTGCREHAAMFLQKRPFNTVEEGERGLFLWSVDFHNHANQITGKKIMSYEDAIKLYYEDNSVCGVSASQVIIERPVR